MESVGGAQVGFPQCWDGVVGDEGCGWVAGGGGGSGYSRDTQLVLPAAAVWMSLTRRSGLRGPVKLQHPQRANVPT